MEHKPHSTLIYGPMFSGKTSRLVQVYEQHVASDDPVLVFKPKLDSRSRSELKTHNGNTVPATEINNATEILGALYPINTGKTLPTIIIDEAQFFGYGILGTISKLKPITDIYVAGLMYDCYGKGFGYMPYIAEIVDILEIKRAICNVCGNPAQNTQRLSDDTSLILIGGADQYCARCDEHFEPGVHRAT